MKMYISFGQDHAHRVNNKTFDCDSICEIKCADHADGRKKAFEAFGPEFMTDYPESKINEIMQYFPRGIIPLVS